MAFSAVLLCSLVATASGAASLAETIDVPHVVYQKGTLGATSSLVEGAAAQQREESLRQASALTMEVKEQVLEDGKGQQSILAPHKKPTVIASALESEGLSNAFEMLEEKKMSALRKALADAMVLKEKKTIDHVTLEETLAKEAQLKSKIALAGKDFAELFEEAITSHMQCQTCLKECPAHEYEAYGVKNEKDCMKNCELVICKENWNPLAGSYKQQLTEFQTNKATEDSAAKPSLFTNYLSEQLTKKGEQGMFYEDEDQDTEIVYDTPSKEQLQQEDDHDSKLDRFLFVLQPASDRKSIEFKQSPEEGPVLAMEAPEDEAARRLSMTAYEAVDKANRDAVGNKLTDMLIRATA